jgi:hypothetical protein
MQGVSPAHPAFLRLFASPENLNELNHQNGYDHHLQDEGTSLVKFIHHESIQLARGSEFLLDKIAIVGDSYSSGSHFVGARVKHVAQEFNGVIGALCQFSDIQTYGVEAFGLAGHFPVAKNTAAMLQ